MKLRINSGRTLLGIGVSVLGFWLAVRQADLEQVLEAFSRAKYLLVLLAAFIQLVTLGIIAIRWQRIFSIRPRFFKIFRVLLIAQLANIILPIRLGVLIRAYLVGRQERVSKTLVFGSVLSEKVFDSLLFVLLFVALLPFVSPDWVRWSSLPLSVGIFFALFPVMFLVTYRRQWFLRCVRKISEHFSLTRRFSLSKRVEIALEGLSPLQGIGFIASLWGWTLLIAGLGIFVNHTMMRAFEIQIPLIAAAFLLVALQIGNRVLPTPLGGMGVFQYICVQALGFFSVDAPQALSFGFMLHFVIFLPGSLLGVLFLFQINESLDELKMAAKD